MNWLVQVIVVKVRFNGFGDVQTSYDSYTSEVTTMDNIATAVDECIASALSDGTIISSIVVTPVIS
jgi:hypothetical protein